MAFLPPPNTPPENTLTVTPVKPTTPRARPSNYRLEKQYQEPYDAWMSDPSPANTGALLRAVRPEITRGITAYVGRTNDPILAGRARKLALQAIKTYDPTKAQLGTHIINQLQGLKRVARQQTQVARIPERLSIENTRIERARVDLVEELGREPSAEELADATGLSVGRIAQVRSIHQPLAEGTISHRSLTDEDAGNMPAVRVLGRDTGDPWAELVYSDLEPVGQKIMEWTLGLHGEPTLSNYEIANRLNISPGAVSQRKAVIQRLLDRREELDPFR